MAKFDESKHKRADDGKFSSGGGSKKSSGGSPKVTAKDVQKDPSRLKEYRQRLKNDPAFRRREMATVQRMSQSQIDQVKDRDADKASPGRGGLIGAAVGAAAAIAGVTSRRVARAGINSAGAASKAVARSGVARGSTAAKAATASGLASRRLLRNPLVRRSLQFQVVRAVVRSRVITRGAQAAIGSVAKSTRSFNERQISRAAAAVRPSLRRAS